jgi:hypothetical protein
MTKPTAPVRVEHDIPSYLSSDEALIHALNRYPSDLLDISRFDFDENGKVVLTPGWRGRAAGETVLDAVRNGQLCVSLREIETAHPGLWGEIEMALGQLAPQTFAKARKLTGDLILSSSTARFPYSFDPANTMLFHLRGVRRVWIYPKTEDFLPQETEEKIIVGESGRELPGVRAKDQEAWRFDIVPGEALAWPLHAPHRIENDEGLCVSVVVKFETPDSAITNGALLANSVLRRWNWEVPDVDKTSPAIRAGLWASSLVFTGLGLVEQKNAEAKPERRKTPRFPLEQEWRIERRSLWS